MTLSRHENGAGVTPTCCRRRRRGGGSAQLYYETTVYQQKGGNDVGLKQVIHAAYCAVV